MRYLALAGLCLVAGCTASQVQLAVTDGQLFCSAPGQSVEAAIYPNGAAFLAKGTAKAVVDAACASVNSTAVSPPPAGSKVSTVTVTPPAITVPLKS